MAHEFDHSLRDRLLSQGVQPGDLEAYRAEVASLAESDRRRVQREHVVVVAFSIFCGACALAWLWFDTESARLPRGPFLAILFFVWGGVEVLKHRIHAARVELLKEIKQLQIQLMELKVQGKQS